MKRKRCTLCDRRFQLYDKYANLHFEKTIGYDSVHDGETFKINLCCECFDSAAYILRKICKFNVFGDLFDFNNDGKLDSFEKAAEFGAFMQMIDSAKNDELTSAGLDPQELSDRGYFERREALGDAGLDPDDYDF